MNAVGHSSSEQANIDGDTGTVHKTSHSLALVFSLKRDEGNKKSGIFYSSFYSASNLFVYQSLPPKTGPNKRPSVLQWWNYLAPWDNTF